MSLYQVASSQDVYGWTNFQYQLYDNVNNTKILKTIELRRNVSGTDPDEATPLDVYRRTGGSSAYDVYLGRANPGINYFNDVPLAVDDRIILEVPAQYRPAFHKFLVVGPGSSSTTSYRSLFGQRAISATYWKVDDDVKYTYDPGTNTVFENPVQMAIMNWSGGSTGNETKSFGAAYNLSLTPKFGLTKHDGNSVHQSYYYQSLSWANLNYGATTSYSPVVTSDSTDTNNPSIGAGRNFYQASGSYLYRRDTASTAGASTWDRSDSFLGRTFSNLPTSSYPRGEFCNRMYWYCRSGNSYPNEIYGIDVVSGQHIQVTGLTSSGLSMTSSWRFTVGYETSEDKYYIYRRSNNTTSPVIRVDRVETTRAEMLQGAASGIIQCPSTNIAYQQLLYGLNSTANFPKGCGRHLYYPGAEANYPLMCWDSVNNTYNRISASEIISGTPLTEWQTGSTNHNRFITDITQTNTVPSGVTKVNQINLIMQTI